MPTPQRKAPEATTKASGDAAEDMALRYLQRQGLVLLHRNFRTPGRGGGEVDLVMREADGTLVFIEVRQRKNRAHGGAAASITSAKQRRVILAARHYLLRMPRTPPCRFDAVCIEAGEIQWIRAAFDAA